MNLSAIIKLTLTSVTGLLLACNGNNNSEKNYQRYNGSYGQANSDPLSVNFAHRSTGLGPVSTVNGSVTLLMSDDNGLALSDEIKTGYSLYIYDEDLPGEASNCDGECIAKWPPLLAGENDWTEAPFSKIVRDDGNLQWALRGMPLYFSTQDDDAGETNGEGETWHVAQQQPLSKSVNSRDGVYLSASGITRVSEGTLEGGFSSQEKNWAGRSLYVSNRHPPGVATCSDACLETWPALLAQPGDIATPPYSFIERTLGNETRTLVKQWALNDKPLHFHVNDGQAGDTSGDGVDGHWQLARPENFKVDTLDGR